jgi:hypothetical protein
MKKESLYILVLLLFALTSCEKNAENVDPPAAEVQLVLYSFISPEDDLTRVDLTLSDPIFTGKKSSGEIKPVTDAIVEIKDGAGNSTILTYVDSVSQYQVSASTFAIQPGQTYYITATSGNKKVSGSCTVPVDNANFSNVKYQKTGDPSSSFSGPYFRYNYEWKDIPGRADYYSVTTASAFVDWDGDTSYRNICQSLPVDDSGNDGQTLSGLCEDFEYGRDIMGGGQFTIAFFLVTSDVHYYEYHKRRIPYQQGDPFSEPYEQYSNVEGGLGLFCSYRKSKTLMKVVQ